MFEKAKEVAAKADEINTEVDAKVDGAIQKVVGSKYTTWILAAGILVVLFVVAKIF